MAVLKVRRYGDPVLRAKAIPVGEITPEIRAIVAQSQKRSAVYDIVTNPTNVTVEVK